jgi:hypothetical protein
MAEGIIAFLVVIYCVVQAFIKRSKLILFLGAIVFSLQLTQWPFFLPFAATASALGLASLGFCSYDFYKKKDKSFVLYGLIFLYFSVLSLLQLFAHSK